MLKEKRATTGLGMKTFVGQDGNTYLVFRTFDGRYHAFVEVEAKQAARECGAKDNPDKTDAMWDDLWATSANTA